MVCVLQSKLPQSTAVFSFIASRFSFHKTFLILAPFISVYHNSDCISHIYLSAPCQSAWVVRATRRLRLPVPGVRQEGPHCRHPDFLCHLLVGALPPEAGFPELPGVHPLEEKWAYKSQVTDRLQRHGALIH